MREARGRAPGFQKFRAKDMAKTERCGEEKTNTKGGRPFLNSAQITGRGGEADKEGGSFLMPSDLSRRNDEMCTRKCKVVHLCLGAAGTNLSPLGVTTRAHAQEEGERGQGQRLFGFFWGVGETILY